MQITIEGIRPIEGAQDQNRLKGRLSLPKDFDANRYTGRWVKKGASVAQAMETQVLIGTTLEADGWAPWKSPKGQNCVRSLTDGAYVLMMRPRALQQNIQKIFGNLSRERLIKEANGETIAGQEQEDRGMLPTGILDRVERQAESPVEGLQLHSFKPNREAATSQVSGRAKPKRN